MQLERGHVCRSGLAGLVAMALALALGVVVAAPTSAATLAVNCPGTNLQAKIDAAHAGDTLLIKGTCVGNFTVDKNLTLKGNPTAVIDGNDAGSTFTIPTTRTVSLIHLTISGGSAQLGGGIFRTGSGHGSLTLNGVTVRDNLATGTPSAEGGGIYSVSGPVRLISSRVVGNRAVVSGSGNMSAGGGGIVVFGPLTIASSSVSSNRVVVSSSGADATARGGGVLGNSGRLTITLSHLDDNHVIAVGADLATAHEGALTFTSPGQFEIASSSVSGNVVSARTSTGTNKADAAWGGGRVFGPSGTIIHSVIANNLVQASSVGGAASAQVGGMQINGSDDVTVDHTRVIGSRVTATGETDASAITGGLQVFSSTVTTIRSSSISTNSTDSHARTSQGFADAGGLLFGGRVSVTKTIIDRNQILSEAGGASATVEGGGMFGDGPLSIRASTISGNTVKGVATGDLGAFTRGGGLFLSGAEVAITNSTIAGNLVHGAADASADEARAEGGGIWTFADSLVLVNSTVARNLVGGTANTKKFQGGGIYASKRPTLKASILALNTAPTGGPNCFGPVGSQGNNVLGTTNGCTFTSKPSDQVNKDPKLGALANNGGPTRTLALLNGSPALDRIPPAACAVAVDQRGVHRPQPAGGKCDVGAFERKA